MIKYTTIENHDKQQVTVVGSFDLTYQYVISNHEIASGKPDMMNEVKDFIDNALNGYMYDHPNQIIDKIEMEFGASLYPDDLNRLTTLLNILRKSLSLNNVTSWHQQKDNLSDKTKKIEAQSKA